LSVSAMTAAESTCASGDSYPLASTENESAEEKEARMERIRQVVARTPGAEVFTDGMKVPGQEESEEREAEWMRGEFDPVGDLMVTGMRLERGEGRTAEEASGPQCGEWDDLVLTLRGSPSAGSDEPFFVQRGSEALLASRAESRWFLELSNAELT